MATLLGTKLNNKLLGTSGNDLLAGLGGNDTLDGGLGTDTAWYSGFLKDFQIGTDGAFLTLSDRNLLNGDDGSDRLINIEQLSFSDAGLTVANGEFRVNSYTTDGQYQNAVSALADGGFVVTWTSATQDSGGSGVYAQRYDALGNAQGGEFRVNSTTANNQSESAVSALADGGFVVTWTSNAQDGSSNGVYAQRYDALGNVQGGEFGVNSYTTNSQSESAVTALADGGFVVTWSSSGQDGSFSGVYAQRYDALGVAQGGEFPVNTTTANWQYESAATALIDGGFLVTWTSEGQDNIDGSAGVYAQRYDALGNAQGGEFGVNTTTTNWQYQSAVTALAGGGFVVTWQSSGQDGDNDGVYAQRFDTLGNAQGGEFRVNTTTTSYQVQSAATALADGGFVVTWTSNAQDGSSVGVYAQRFDALGNAQGSEFRVNTTTAGDQTDSAVTALSDGGFLVTWASLEQDGSSYGVYAQRYDAQGNAVGLKVTGTAAAETLNLGLSSYLTVDGAGGNDTITGGASDDNLFGGLGNDRLLGSDGADRLDGGAGNDALIGGNGGDTYVVNSTLDVVTETGVGGSDTVEASFSFTLGATLENLTLTGTGHINGTGNASGNLLIGNGGDNKLDGKAGGDLMAGGAGNDTYVVDSLFDLVSENAGQGTDIVQSSVTFTLSSDVEHLTLTGAANLNGTGNELSNTLTGNAGANSLAGGDAADTLNGLAGNDTLAGGDGDDWLNGGGGNDLLTGEAGSDVFRFDSALSSSNVDLIADFVTGTDDIYLTSTLFANAGGGGGGQLNGADFASGAIVSAIASQHILYETDTGNLYYNADGSGAGALTLFAVLDGAPTLASTDIFLV